MHALGVDLIGELALEGATVLDVGSGSGFVSALLAHLVGPTGRTITSGGKGDREARDR